MSLQCVLVLWCCTGHRLDFAKKTAQCFGLLNWLIGSSIFLFVILAASYRGFVECYRLFLKHVFGVVRVGSTHVTGFIPRVKEGHCVYLIKGVIVVIFVVCSKIPCFMSAVIFASVSFSVRASLIK